MKEQELNKTKTFSVRLDRWLYDKLVAASAINGKNEYIKNLLIQNLNEQEKNNERTTDEQLPGLLKELQLKDEIIKSKDQTIGVLENQNGFLISEFEKMRLINEKLLMPSQEEQKEKGKQWWHFWKK
jgi:hypothetical protein